MLWLQTPPWGRWIAAGLVVAAAFWVELRPEPLVDHPFAVTAIAPGDQVNESNTEPRRVPTGLFEPVELGQVAVRGVDTGSPVLGADVGEGRSVVPSGWWIVSTHVPPSATPGDAVSLILLESGSAVEGVVVTASVEDPFGDGSGGVAIPADSAAEVATAAANGRLAVLVSTG